MSVPVRILHLHSTFNLGGKEARAVRLMNLFGPAASHVILSAEPTAMQARDAIAPGIAAQFPDDAPPLYGKPAPGRYLALARYMRQFDLILSYNWGSMDGVMAHRLLERTHRLPRLIHHEDGFNNDAGEPDNAKRNWFRRIALQGSRQLVVPSETLRDTAFSRWAMDPARLHFIPNGIPVDDYATPAPDAIPSFHRREGEVVIGTVAGLRAVKNLPRLVRAFAPHAARARLVIIGSGPERDRIMAEAAALNIASRVILPGFLPDPARYIGLFDIFALSSDSEQCPISLVEAMAAALPAVSTQVGDVANMVSPENRPFVTQLGDDAAYAAALARLVQDAPLRRSVGDANRIRAADRYAEQAMVDRYARLYGVRHMQGDTGAIEAMPFR